MYRKKRRSLLEDVRQDRAVRPQKKVAAHNQTVHFTLIVKPPPNLALVLQKKSMDVVIAAKMELGVESLDSTKAQSVAGQHLATMSVHNLIIGVYSCAPQTKPIYCSNYGSCSQKNIIRGGGNQCCS